MIITNYGNNHSGKTTFSVALANRLLEKDKTTTAIIINFDNNIPAHALWEPTRDITKMYSMGALIEEAKIDQKILPKYILTHENHKNIGLLGYCIGDTPLSYVDITYEKVLDIIKAAQQLADYVIIDASSPLLTEQLTASIEMADCLNVLITPDNEGVIYYKTSKKMFSRSKKFLVENTNYILSPVKSYNAVDNIKNGLQREFLELPYSLEIDVQNCNGNMFNILKSAPKKYKKTIDSIIKTFA